MLSEIIQTQKDKYHKIYLICAIKKKDDLIERERQWDIPEAEEQRERQGK